MACVGKGNSGSIPFCRGTKKPGISQALLLNLDGAKRGIRPIRKPFASPERAALRWKALKCNQHSCGFPPRSAHSGYAPWFPNRPYDPLKADSAAGSLAGRRSRPQGERLGGRSSIEPRGKKRFDSFLSRHKKARHEPGYFVEFGWCPEAESNHRHEDFQSSALPTELSGQNLSKLHAVSAWPNCQVCDLILCSFQPSIMD